MAEATNGARRGRPPGQTNLDSLYLQWKRSTELATNPDAEIEAEVERYRAQLKERVGLRAQLAKVDAQAALARFQIHGGKVKGGVPVNNDGTPYVTNAEKAEAEKAKADAK